MRILLIENTAGAADPMDRALTVAGHDVVRCHVPGDPDGECLFLRGQGLCPLHTAPADVAVDVRLPAADGSVPSGIREVGAVCAVHDNVPLIVVGPVDPAAFPWSEAAAFCEPAEIAARLRADHGRQRPNRVFRPWRVRDERGDDGA